MPQMPKKLVFLKSDEDFSNFKRSKSLASDSFRLRWYYPKSQNLARFGFIVPKKVMKRVTDRNLVKRRLKAILARALPNISNVDVLFFPKPGSIKLKFADLESEVLGALKKARIYADPGGSK
jgi:ribonuclease P protein component